jgi:WD40 repeat protein
MRARWILVPLILFVTGACTGTTTAPDRPRPSIPDVVVLGTSAGTVVVESDTGSVLSPDAGEVVAPDGSRLYATVPDGGSTLLETRDPLTGELLARTPVAGRMDVRVASISGRAVAMMRPLPQGVDPTIPLPRARTHIAVADPTGEAPARSYWLTGNFEPEAFSLDDGRLFLIQHLPAEAPSVYRVTFLDLETGHVRQVFGRFKTPPERMPGIRLEQVFDPVAEQLYTLYSNEPLESYQGEWQGAAYGGRVVSFVHVLNLRKGWAYCAGLPRALWGQPAAAQAMASSPDGRSLFVVDAMRGLIAEMNTRTLEIERTAKMDLGSVDGGRTSAVMSADGDTLFVGSARDGAAVYAVDVETLEIRERWPMTSTVTGLGLSGDGLRLYAAVDDRVAIVDTATGRAFAALSFEGVDSILHVATQGT